MRLEPIPTKRTSLAEDGLAAPQHMAVTGLLTLRKVRDCPDREEEDVVEESVERLAWCGLCMKIFPPLVAQVKLG